LSLKIIDESKINQNKYVSKDMLAPAQSWYVVISFTIALTLNFIPLQSFALVIRPDFVALIILYWSINQPQQFGMGVAFFLGLMMDVHHAGILGHHALVYCVIVSIASVSRRRIKIFGLVQQTPQVFLILIITQGLFVFIALLNDANMPDWQYFLGSLSGSILWPITAFILSYPLKLGSDADAL